MGARFSHNFVYKKWAFQLAYEYLKELVAIGFMKVNVVMISKEIMKVINLLLMTYIRPFFLLLLSQIIQDFPLFYLFSFVCCLCLYKIKKKTSLFKL